MLILLLACRCLGWLREQRTLTHPHPIRRHPARYFMAASGPSQIYLALKIYLGLLLAKLIIRLTHY